MSPSAPNPMRSQRAVGSLALASAGVCVFTLGCAQQSPGVSSQSPPVAAAVEQPPPIPAATEIGAPEDTTRPYVVVWTAGAPGVGRAGFVVQRGAAGVAQISGTTAAARGRTWDFGLASEALNLELPKYVVISPSGEAPADTHRPGRWPAGPHLLGPITQWEELDVKVDSKTDSVVANAVVATVATKAEVRGFIISTPHWNFGKPGAINLYPSPRAFRATGSVVLSSNAQGQSRQTFSITGVDMRVVDKPELCDNPESLPCADGRVELALLARDEAGHEARYVLPDLVSSAIKRALYRGPVVNAASSDGWGQTVAEVLLREPRDPVGDYSAAQTPGVVVAGPKLQRLLGALGPDVVFFTSSANPIKRLADITDLDTQFAADLSSHFRPSELVALGYELGGEPDHVPKSVGANLAKLFADRPALRLFMTRAPAGSLGAILQSGGGMRVTFVAPQR